MKSLPGTIALVLAALVGTVFVTSAAIEWSRGGAPIFEHRSGARTIQLGLRGDGVVVWREITNAESVTNSPAEPPPRLTSPEVRNPIWMTNFVISIDPVTLRTNDLRLWIYTNAPVWVTNHVNITNIFLP